MRHLPNLALITILFAEFSALQAAEPNPPEGFRAIFNGKDLTGWHGLNPHSGANLTGEKKDANLKQQRADFPQALADRERRVGQTTVTALTPRATRNSATSSS